MIRRYTTLAGILMLMLGCANPAPAPPAQPLTTPIDAIENRPKTERQTIETRRVDGFVIEHPQIGKVRYLSAGFSTAEGDFCNLFVSIEHGFISAHNGTWSGHDCPWPRDGRHVPLDREAVRAITDAINDDAGGLRVYSPSDGGQLMEERATITTDRDEYNISVRIEDAMIGHTNRLLDQWLARDVGGPLPDLSTVASLDGRFARARLEPHGVLVMTITQSTGSKNRLWVLADSELTEIRELTQSHPPTDWAEGESGRSEFMVSFGGVHRRYWPQSAPANVHRLMELTALREHEP